MSGVIKLSESLVYHTLSTIKKLLERVRHTVDTCGDKLNTSSGAVCGSVDVSQNQAINAHDATARGDVLQCR